jgi:hypothetical protein
MRERNKESIEACTRNYDDFESREQNIDIKDLDEISR